MNVLMPQYVVSPIKTEANLNYSVLLSSRIGENDKIDPTTNIWSSSSHYTTDTTVYYLDTEGVCNGCWCEYKALQDSIDKNPYSEQSYWVKTDVLEQYKMFDQFNNSKTTSVDGNIIIYIHCKAITDIALINVQAKTIKIDAWNCRQMSEITENNKILSNVDNTLDFSKTIPNWYDYFFSDFEKARNISRPIALTSYNNILLKIEFEKHLGLDCYVGNCIPGRRYNIGSLQYGIRTGIIDYSKKLFDETFGSHYIKEGNYRKTLDCDLLINNTDLNYINSIFTQLRAKPTIYQGNEEDITEYDNLLVYGILKNFNIIMQYYSHSECNLEIEGII